MARIPPGARLRPGGMFEKRFSVDGCRYSVYAYSAKELVEKEWKLREDIDKGLVRKADNPTLDQYFDKWISAREGQIKGNTIKGYMTKYKQHISPVLGTQKIRKIDRRMIKNLQVKCAQELKESTANSVMTVLKAVLNDAVREGVLEKTPMKYFEAIKVKERATDSYHRALSEWEQEAFMKEAKLGYYYGIFAFMLCTGMRAGEACAILWQDVDLETGTIFVRRTVTYNAEGKIEVGTPKTLSGMRDIPINDSCRKILEFQKKRNREAGFPADGLVFPAVNGGMIRNGALNHEISRIRKKLAEQKVYIDHFTSHALRDTFATRYIEQGGSPELLRDILGHSSIAITMDLYSQVLLETKRREMERSSKII